MACKFNCHIETEVHLKVTGSHVHYKSGDVSEIVQDRDVVTSLLQMTNRKWYMSYQTVTFQITEWPSFTYRVTCIIVNDFESENLYVVNFINRQTLYRSIGMISKIIWRKYYTTTIIILSNIATPKHCTITQWQHYFKILHSIGGKPEFS